jgi:hypothetical protein
MSQDFIAGELTCPFCHAPWSVENLRFYNLDAGDHCDSGRFYAECVDVQIICHACDRLMYSKQGQELR